MVFTLLNNTREYDIMKCEVADSMSESVLVLEIEKRISKKLYEKVYLSEFSKWHWSDLKQFILWLNFVVTFFT